jgi:hypothetical protein
MFVIMQNIMKCPVFPQNGMAAGKGQEVASCHASGNWNVVVAPRFLEKSVYDRSP